MHLRSGTALIVAGVAMAWTVPSRKAESQVLERVLDRLGASQVDTAKANALSALFALGQAERFPICSPASSPRIRRTLVKALEDQNLAALRPHPEAESEYYASLIGCVAALHDPAAVKGLLGAIGTGGGAINGLVVLGDAAVPGLLQLLDAPGSPGGVAAVVAAGKLASRNAFPQLRDQSPELSPSARAAIRLRLIDALSNENTSIRTAAIQGLDSYSDSAIALMIAIIAESDPAVVDSGDGKRDYPVRQAALAWLRNDSLKQRRAN